MLPVLCCLLVLLAGCSGVGDASGNNQAPTPSPETTKAPQITPTPTVDPNVARVREIIKGMSIDEKIGQLIIVEYIGAGYTPELQYMVTKQHVGGYLYQEVNHNFDAPNNTIQAVSQMAEQVNKDAKIPLLSTIDEEGGLVNKLSTFYGAKPSARDMAQSGDPETAFQEGSKMAKEMLQLGIYGNLAPVVDVESGSPPLLASRTFSSDPAAVATYAGRFVDGLQQNGVIATLKHFPGLGSLTTSDDPHETLPTVNRSLDDLQKIDLAPYKELIAKHKPAMIMTTNVVTTALDPELPAELSPKVVDGVLRKQLGYDGVVITDGLYMKGISNRWNIGEASVLAIIAGNDLVEGPFTSDQVASVISAFKEALQTGRLTEQRLDQSLERILLMKLRFNMLH
jgi:beta-N-acetylhexosaminidase